jgi:hypothetical protein
LQASEENSSGAISSEGSARDRPGERLDAIIDYADLGEHRKLGVVVAYRGEDVLGKSVEFDKFNLTQ